MSDAIEGLRVYVGDILGAYSKDVGACQRLPYGMSREEQRRMMLAHLDEMSKALSLTLPALARLGAAKRWKVACKSLMVAVGMDPVRVAAAETPEEALPPEWNE